MSRHRIVRSMDYNDEYDGYDDVYGHSVDEDTCISPTDAQQWLYDRARGQQSMSSFIATHRNIEEEDENPDETHGARRRHSSEDFQMPILNDENQARLLSCMEEIRNVVGEAVSEKQLVETILKHDYDCAKSLDEILNSPVTAATGSISETKSPKPEIEKANLIKQRSSSKSVGLGKKFDFNKPQLPASLPLNDDITQTTFTKLSDFAQFHLQKSNSELSSSPTSLLGSGMSIPRLNIPIGGPSTTARTTTTTDRNTGFFIPKLTNSPKFGTNSPITTATTVIGTELTPHEISLKRIMDLKKLKISEPEPVQPKGTDIVTSPIDADKILIDLSTALRTDITIPITGTVNIKQPKTEQEPFIPKYIDCDQPGQLISPMQLPSITEDCEIDVSGLIYAKLPATAKVLSKFGKILCSRYRCKRLPYVRHDFERKNLIQPYLFVQASPDDIILRQLQKWK